MSTPNPPQTTRPSGSPGRVRRFLRVLWSPEAAAWAGVTAALVVGFLGGSAATSYEVVNVFPGGKGDASTAAPSPEADPVVDGKPPAEPVESTRPSEPEPTASASNDPGWVVTWNDGFTFGRHTDLDQDGDPHNSNLSGGAELSVVGAGRAGAYLVPDSTATLGVVPGGDADPGPERCSEIARQESVEKSSLTAGDRYCLLAHRGTAALIKVVSVNARGADDSEFTATLVRWSPQ
ncbi:hypothetical protein V1L54_25035 [Streptomyces sp. TRM 70361]|uniref:hypothetical protein n=1 Tax=Streptomyces sp. TRM 70361 TaxID=3116553 RepID=UPI002E7B20D0|nr:hypothetical protein [Streptomyces sp. TRM 70361]MEE1942630.1 hypothetical protein [Streptomyces sp. TRM 70361]